jgi:hypothetical protein
MKRFEYEMRRMKRGIVVGLSKTEHDKKLMQILNEMGEKGWELKTLTVWTSETILVFCREMQ